MFGPGLSPGLRVPKRTSRQSLHRIVLLVLGMSALLGCRRATARDDAADIDSEVLSVSFIAAAIPVDSTSDREPLEAELTNSLGMKMICILPGEFLMGSVDSEDDWDRDETLHHVRIGRLFYLASHEVTVAQFRRFVEATGYKTDAEQSNYFSRGFNSASGQLETMRRLDWRNPSFPQGDDHPVVHTSWNDAVAFCQWLSAVEGKPYRLPTEAEWEYACRAGSKTRYWSGDDEESAYRVANFSGAASWPTGAAGSLPFRPRITLPVGSFPKNDFGLRDMHGNVAEWCSDWYERDYYRRSPVNDPQGPGSGSQRVTRGGSFLLRPWHGRSANRSAGLPGFHSLDLGFRVAMTHR